MAGYQILEDNSKKDNILKMEGICPICSYYPSQYIVLKKESGKKETRQFKYNCLKCKSVWTGNIYDNLLNLV